MSNVVDIRKDTFIRILGEGTGIMEAGDKAGIEHDELMTMLQDNSKFRLTVREVVIDRMEDHMRQEVGKMIAAIQHTSEEAIKLLHNQLEEGVAAIHGFQSNE